VTPHLHGWRRRDARAVYEAHAGPNMTPMVDVVMVILIFFMASTVIIGPEMLLRAGLEPDAPGAGSADPRFAVEAPTFRVSLRLADGAVVVDGLGLRDAPVSAAAHAARSLAEEVDTDAARLVIAPGDDVPYEAAVAVQDALIAAGFTSIGLR